MNRLIPIVAGVGLVAIAFAIAPVVLPSSVPGEATATPPADPDSAATPPFRGGVDLLAAEETLRRQYPGSLIRHVEFDPDDESGIAVEFEVVRDGRSRMVEVRRFRDDDWRIIRTVERESSVRSRRYLERLAGILRSDPPLDAGEAAALAETRHPGARAIEVDLVLAGETAVYEVELVAADAAFEVHVPAQPTDPTGTILPVAPPCCSACLVTAVEAAADYGIPLAFRTLQTVDDVEHEIWVLGRDGLVRLVRSTPTGDLESPSDVQLADRPAPRHAPPSTALAAGLRALERTLLATGGLPPALSSGELERFDAAADAPPAAAAWRLRTWTPTRAGVLEATVDPLTDAVVLRLQDGLPED
jgi:hypothetical protein